jgi:hypothetical protein
MWYVSRDNEDDDRVLTFGKLTLAFICCFLQRDSYVYPPFLLYFAALSFWLALMAHWTNQGKPALQRFAWGVAGGSITGPQNFLKDALIVLKANSRQSDSHHLPWWFILLVALAMISAFSGLLLLTACMKRYDVTFSSAMFVGSFIVSTSIMSIAHYGTFENLHSWTSCVMYPVGLLVLMSGVWMLVLEADDDDAVSLDFAPDDIMASLQAPLIARPSIMPVSAGNETSTQRHETASHH